MKPSTKRAMAVAFAIGAELIASVLVGVFAGCYAGREFDFAEWGAVIGTTLGFSLWIWRMVKVSKEYKP